MYRWLLGASLTLGVIGSLNAQELSIQQHTLSNGLKVYMQEDHTTPLMSFYIFYDVGSVNESPGITGISHLFEHMMFNGSEHYAPKEFDHRLEAAGGSSNGYTDRDMTAYLEDFPPTAFDLVLDLEADRMASMRITPENLEQERGIVKEERRLRTDNDHEGKLDELLYLMAYVSHPYRNPVVGFMADLNHISLDDTRRYFDTYYIPNNALAVVSGDFDPKIALKKMEKAFAPVQSGPPPPTLFASEPDQEGERRATILRDAELPMLMAGWHVPGAAHKKEAATLDILQALLSVGDSSRLHQSLIYSKEVATRAWAWNATYRGPSLFVIYLQGAPGKDIAEAEGALLTELETLAQSPVSARELRKAKNQLRAHSLRSLKTVSGRANQIGSHALTFGSPDAIKELIDLRDAVTAEEIQQLTQQYFTQKNRTIITLLPRPDDAGDADISTDTSTATSGGSMEGGQ